MSNRSIISPVWLTDDVVDRLLTHDLAQTAVAAALACHARGNTIQLLKPYLRPRGRDGEREGGRFIAMPAFVGGDIQAAGLKWISGFPANIDKGLPRASGLVVLNDLTTGVPIAVMDCATLSARRTGAVAALAFDHLAPTGDRIVSILGAGPINGEVVAALASHARNIRSLRIFDPREDRAMRLVAVARQCGLDANRFDTPQDCVRGANVIIPATTGAKGYIKRQWLGSNWLIIALSLDDFEPDVLLGADKVICDDYEQCAREEKLIHRLAHAGQFDRGQMHAELGEIVAHTKPGREGIETIYVNPMGMAIEDIAAAAAVDRQYIAQTHS